MSVTITLDPCETSPFATATRQAITYSEEVLEAAKALKMTPEEIAEAAKEEEMTPEDYAFIMMLSKKINHNIAKRVAKDFNLDFPYIL